MTVDPISLLTEARKQSPGDLLLLDALADAWEEKGDLWRAGLWRAEGAYRGWMGRWAKRPYQVFFYSWYDGDREVVGPHPQSDLPAPVFHQLIPAPVRCIWECDTRKEAMTALHLAWRRAWAKGWRP